MSVVSVIEYQAAWPAQYLQVLEQIRSVLPSSGFTLEHVGSTAVPGLCAKPVLDILLGVSELVQVEANTSCLANLGFIYRPEYEAQIPQRRYFVRPEGTTLRVHLHAVVQGSELWLNHLQFRYALRHDRQLMLSYASLKQELATKHASNKAAYTEAKSPFITGVLAAFTQDSATPVRSAA